MHTIKIRVPNWNNLWIFIIIYMQTIFFWWLYESMGWWMFFCSLFAFTIQFVIGCSFLLHESKKEKVMPFDKNLEIKLKKNLRLYRVCYGFLLALTIGIDLFPFYKFSHYKGNFLVYCMIILICGFWVLMFGNVYEKEFDYKRVFKEKSKQINKLEKERILQEQKINNIKKQIIILEKEFGNKEFEFIIRNNDINIENYLVCFNNETLLIQGKIYHKSQILSLNLIDSENEEERIVSDIEPFVVTTKTSSKSLIGRAALGGLLFGIPGAIIGAATAKKKTKIENLNKIPSGREFRKKIKSYTLIIGTTNIQDSTIIIELGTDKNKAYKIYNTLNSLIVID